jgi:serine phosphatase RsbU (regulator of sigma subunit)
MKTKISFYLLLTVSFLFGHLDLNAQSTNIDSTVTALQALPDDTAKVRLINEFLWDNIFSGIQPKLVDLGERNIQRAKKLLDYSGAGTAAKNTAAFFYYGGDYSAAEAYYKTSLKLYQQAEDLKGIAAANQNLGNIYSQRGNWKQALDYYFESLKSYEAIDEQGGIARVLDAIGNVYNASSNVAGSTDQDLVRKALDYYHRALEVKKKMNNERGLIASYLYIGDMFFTSMTDSVKILQDSAEIAQKELVIQQQGDSALFYFMKAKKLNEIYQNPQFEGMLSDGIAEVFLNKQAYDSAYTYYKNALKAKEQMGNAFGIASTKYYLGNFFYETGRIDSALIYYNDALDIAQNINAGQVERSISMALGNIYMDEGKFEQSANFYRNFISLNDSLQNEENTRRMTQLEMQYEFDKKEKIREEQAKRQRVILYFFIAGFLLMVLMALLIFRSYRVKQKANRMLEEKNLEISQKNVMLNRQNEEIEAQRDEIESQRDFVITQRDKIAEQNKNITDSIVYAQRIQQAVLPPESFIRSLLPDHFILFKPRDIVSGDFYWAGRRDDKIVITAADSTGHGVPGAFMSLLGVSFLNEIISEFNGQELKPHEILNRLRTKIKTSLRQTGEAKESKDGMDMALCVIDPETNELEYAGANNSMLRVRNNELTKFKADRMPVGVHYRDEQSFKTQSINAQAGDVYYIFSDGYVDQFGGKKGRKFMLPRFKELILENHHKPMAQQKEIFDKTIEEWRNHPSTSLNEPHEQLDDILVIGFKI